MSMERSAILMTHDGSDQDHRNQLNNNKKGELLASGVEALDVGLIFGFKEFLTAFLDGLGHTILFPIAACASLIRAILTWREAKLGAYKDKSVLLRAGVETGVALAITTAVVGTLVSAAAFTLLGPVIFTAAMAFKAAYHLGAAVYYGIRALAEPNRRQQAIFTSKMKNNAVSAVTSILATLVCGLVLIAHKASFGLLGVASGVIGAGYAAYQFFTLSEEQDTRKKQQVAKSQAILIEGKKKKVDYKYNKSLEHSPIGGKKTSKVDKKDEATSSTAQILEGTAGQINFATLSETLASLEEKQKAKALQVKKAKASIDALRKEISKQINLLIKDRVISTSEHGTDAWHIYVNKHSYTDTFVMDGNWKKLDDKFKVYLENNQPSNPAENNETYNENKEIINKLHLLLDEHNKIIKDNEILFSEEVTQEAYIERSRNLSQTFEQLVAELDIKNHREDDRSVAELLKLTGSNMYTNSSGLG